MNPGNNLPERNIAIIGYGRLGGALAQALSKAGMKITGIVEPVSQRHSERLPFFKTVNDLDRNIDLVFICVPDDCIKNVIAEIAEYKGFKQNTIIAHTAGSHSSDILAPLKEFDAKLLAWHPLQTFTGFETPEVFRGITIGMDGDREAVEIGMKLAEILGSTGIEIPPEARTAWHLAAVLVSGMTVGLLSEAEDLMKSTGIDSEIARNALAPLCLTTVQNFRDRGTQDASTGPLVRGDVETIKRHIDFLKDRTKTKSLYSLINRILLQKIGKVTNSEEMKRLFE